MYGKYSRRQCRCLIVNANNLTDKEIAQVEDIVKRKTDAKASDIVITPVGVTGEEQ